MSDSPPSRPAHKVYTLASIFVNIATVYMESREQEAAKIPSASQEPTPLNAHEVTNKAVYQPTAPVAWGPIDPFLHALGFTEDPSLDINGASGTNANLENWFNGTQHIMGLLEDDLGYLDDAVMNFGTL
jgi:hypothetical protein